MQKMLFRAWSFPNVHIISTYMHINFNEWAHHNNRLSNKIALFPTSIFPADWSFTINLLNIWSLHICFLDIEIYGYQTLTSSILALCIFK